MDGHARLLPRLKLPLIALAFLGGTLSVTLKACESEHQVREQLLSTTPIGTTFEQVLSFCAAKKLKCRQSRTAGFLNQETGNVVGVQAIWAVVSESKTGPLSIASISAYWGFDGDGRLLDIWVWKTVDAP